MTASKYYSDLFCKTIDCLKSKKTNLIFVILGQTNILDIDNRVEFIADIDTFRLEKNEQVFSKDWFSKVFIVLNSPKEYHILSFAQFSYLIHYIDPSFFKERVVILKDNLRDVFPIHKEDYLEQDEKDTIELRPEGLPINQAEQFALNGKYFYSIKSLLDNYNTFEIFSDTKDLRNTDDESLETINFSSDSLAIDIFINECFEQNNLNKKAAIRFYKKQPHNQTIVDRLRKLNYLLSKFGGELFLIKDYTVSIDYQVSEGTNNLLKQHWGENASFRNISIYKNPNFGNETVEISQGFFVDTIINEHENSRKGKPYRDFFLTAPTGAGKSLLFLLPSFHVSNNACVTIIVSPLIALMNDQVDAIRTQRGFEKVAFINSELSLIDRERIIQNCKEGEIDILFMSPELLLSYDIKHFIGDRQVGLMVIDEAHLITTWGRDFRVDYWFLGNHIRKMNKYHNMHFPVVAVTATAIYGESNDMVFDSIDSLDMHDPHIFIGQVKRHDIEFVVNNYDSFSSNYETKKLNQTKEFIIGTANLGLKTLVYAPFRRHIQKIIEQVNFDNPGIATGYHGQMEADPKEYAYRSFKSGEIKTMVSTKAFGMGVDIPDIQVVYHHAPSGLLADYVQEIGRVARDTNINGVAALNYTSQDQRYSRALHGMSAIRLYQLKEVLKKIHKSYLKNKKNRNLLLSVDDFGHIFEDAFDLDQKVLTSLMMIEKDYLAKTRFNVIVARPKKLYVKVYARINETHLSLLQQKYSNTFTILRNMGNGVLVIELDLDRLWHKYFFDKSFPVLKREFYTEDLFKKDSIDLKPQLKMSFERHFDYRQIHEKLKRFLKVIQSIFANTKGFFTEDDFKSTLNGFLKDENKVKKLSKFVLSTYSGRLIQQGEIEPHAFLQRRRNIDGYSYRVFNVQYLASFSSLEKRLINLFQETDSSTVDRYVTNKELNAVQYLRLGYFMEMLELGTFEVKGGTNPMLFLRINDPGRIERDSKNRKYSNLLLSKTLEKHSISSQIFDHFFLRSFSNEERWNFIEDFFLGSDVDSLIEKYQGGEINSVDVIKEIEKKDFGSHKIEHGQNNGKENSNIHIFPPNQERKYGEKDLLTIENKNEPRTMTVSKWLMDDPVSFDKVRRNNKLRVYPEVFEVLVSKLRANHPEYFANALGLKTRIDFPGYERPVQASVPYKDKPVKFYEWWCENQQAVNMKLEEKITLFDKVLKEKPRALKKEHKRRLNQKS